MNEEMHKLENELRDLESKISQTAQVYRREMQEFGKAKGDYEIASANALLGIYDLEGKSGDKNTESVRKAKALQQTSEKYLAYRIAEANADSSKEVLRSFLAQLSAVQTRCGLLKAEASLVAGNYK